MAQAKSAAVVERRSATGLLRQATNRPEGLNHNRRCPRPRPLLSARERPMTRQKEPWL